MKNEITFLCSKLKALVIFQKSQLITLQNQLPSWQIYVAHKTSILMFHSELNFAGIAMKQDFEEFGVILASSSHES